MVVILSQSRVTKKLWKNTLEKNFWQIQVAGQTIEKTQEKYFYN